METKDAETRNAETVTISRAEYEQLQGQISALEKQVELLTEALRLSRQKRFGESSERTSEDTMEPLSLLFNEAEVYADQAVKEDDGSVTVAAHKRHKKHEYIVGTVENRQSSADKMACGFVVVLGGRQPACILRLATHDFLSPPFCRFSTAPTIPWTSCLKMYRWKW